MNDTLASLSDLTDRNREIFRRLVETYLETGEPIGSRTLSRQIESVLSPASVRNVMQDLEMMGLLAAPHVSAGRVPTEIGLRLFIDGFLQVSNLSAQERDAMRRALGDNPRDMPRIVDDAGAMLSGLSQCASFVVAPKADDRIRHVEVAALPSGKTLLVLVGEDGTVENRLIDAAAPPSALTEAANFLNARLRGLRLGEARQAVAKGVAAARAELDSLAARLVEQGVVQWTTGGDRGALAVRGLSHLLDNAAAAKDLDRLKRLFDDLERHENIDRLITLAQEAEGVRVFIGSETELYSLSDSSIVVSQYATPDKHIVGAVGVIGPKRLNYARIVPIVDYTARLMGRLSDGAGGAPAAAEPVDSADKEIR